MSLLDNPCSGKPDFINDAGVKWWIDKDMQEYAFKSGLDDIHCWFVEEKNGRQCRLFTIKQAVIWEGQKLEEAAVHIDIMKLQRKI